MLRSKKRHMTIGDAAAAPAAPAAEGVDALRVRAGIGGDLRCHRTAKSLVEELRSAGAARVLVVNAGTTGESIVAGCLAAGLMPCVAYTEDMARGACEAAPKNRVRGQSRETGALDDSYRVLSAAESADAQAILLVDSRLAVESVSFPWQPTSIAASTACPWPRSARAFGGITRVAHLLGAKRRGALPWRRLVGHVPEVPPHRRAARACQPQNVPRVRPSFPHDVGRALGERA